MSNRQKYSERLIKMENLRKKRFRKAMKRKNLIRGRKLNEKKEVPVTNPYEKELEEKK